MNKKILMSRKRLVISGVIVGVLAVFGGYTAVSMQQWQRLKSDIDRSMNGLRKDAKLLFASSTNSRERYIIIDRLADSSAEQSCNIGWWGDWQSMLFTGAEEIKGACDQAHNHRTAVEKQAKKTQQFLDDQTMLQTTLVGLSLGKVAVTEDDFAKHAETASSIDEELKEMSLGAESRPLLTSAQDVVSKISKAWQGVQKADKAKNRKQYEAAIDALDQAYHELGAVSKQAATSYTALLTDLEKTLPQ